MKRKKIVIVDYGIGNVKSMYNALYNLGIDSILSSDKDTILDAPAVILPGVGAFQKGMENLYALGLFETIHSYVRSGKPFLGVCLGMQMLLEESEEFGLTAGLGLIKGKVIRLPTLISEKEKLPHVNWNQLYEPSDGRWNNTILDGFSVDLNVYFVHSFAAVPRNETSILSITKFGGEFFCSAINQDNIYGTQFHPEKSGNAGLLILSKFINLIK